MANLNLDDPANAGFKEWMQSTGKQFSFKKEVMEDYYNQYQNQKKSEGGRLENLMTGGTPAFSVSGSNNEIQGRIEGLERAKILTGQNPYEIGENYKDSMNKLKARTEGSDTASELLRANKAGAIADAKNTLQNQGVKGGAALNAISAVERAKSYDVNNQLVQAQKDAETQYQNAIKGVANYTNQMEMGYGQMAAGKDFKMPESNSNGFGTVICTELYRQGYFSELMWQKDQEYGRKILDERPEVYVGYRYLADPVVIRMKRSKKFTKLVALLAVPWAKHISGEKNLIGGFITLVGEPICALIGRTNLGVAREN